MNIVETIKIVNQMQSAKLVFGKRFGKYGTVGRDFGQTRFKRKMERKQTPAEFAAERAARENINQAKRKFRFEQQNLSFNEKMQIAFSLSERDRQLKKAKKK